MNKSYHLGIAAALVASFLSMNPVGAAREQAASATLQAATPSAYVKPNIGLSLASAAGFRTVEECRGSAPALDVTSCLLILRESQFED